MNKLSFVVFGLILLTSLSYADEAISPDVQLICPDNALEITVVHGTFLEPLPSEGVIVRILNATGVLDEGITDAEGKIRFAISSTGRYIITTQNEGADEHEWYYEFSRLCEEEIVEEVTPETEEVVVIELGCTPVGNREEVDGVSSYCSLDGTYENQKDNNAICKNNYECKSDYCSNNDKCININNKMNKLTKKYNELDSIINKILAFLRDTFSFEL